MQPQLLKVNILIARHLSCCKKKNNYLAYEISSCYLANISINATAHRFVTRISFIVGMG